MANEILWSKLGNSLTNGTLNRRGSTPTINTSNGPIDRGLTYPPTGTTSNNTVWNYGAPGTTTYGDGIITRDGYVVYNPANWNRGYDSNRNGSSSRAQSLSYQPFSTSDVLSQRANAYQTQGLDGLANSYRTLNSENSIWNNTANKIADYYSQLANDINSREQGLANVKNSLANQLSQDIANQRQYVMDYYGPNGIFTNEVNKFYDEQGNYLASEAGRQMAMANAEGIQSGASLGAQRAARNEAYNNAFQNYLKVREQELTAKMNIQSQLINYIQALREEYGNTQNAYVIQQYQRANDLLNTISNSLNESQVSLAQAKLQQAISSSGSGSSTNELVKIISRLESGSYERDENGNLTAAGKAQLAVDKMSVNQLGGTVTQNGNLYNVDLSNTAYLEAFKDWVNSQNDNSTDTTS